MNAITTRQQKMAERAYQAASTPRARSKEYASFAKSFPALIHTAGLCQAVAFAQAKGKGTGAQSHVLADVLDVYNVASDKKYASAATFADAVRVAPVTEYLRLSRLALQAATWIKRYVEALEGRAPAVAEVGTEPARRETAGG